MKTKIPYTIVLGGSRGLGQEIAAACLKKGGAVMELANTYHVWPLLHDRDPLQRAVRIPIDLLSEESVDETHQRLEKIYNEDMGLVCTKLYWVAGVLTRTSWVELEWRDAKRMIMINWMNALRFVDLIWKHTDRGDLPFHLITVACTAGLSEQPKETEAVYAGTKAAQIVFTRAVGKGNADPDARVSLFIPEAMKTQLWGEGSGIDSSNFLDPKDVAKMIVDDVASQTEPYFERILPCRHD